MVTTRTFTENQGSGNKSTWTLSATSYDMVTDGSGSVSFTVPRISAKYVGTNKGYATAGVQNIKIHVATDTAGTSIVDTLSGYWWQWDGSSGSPTAFASWASGATKSLVFSVGNAQTVSINPASYFTSATKNNKVLYLVSITEATGQPYYSEVDLESARNGDGTTNTGYYVGKLGSLVFGTLTLDAPPTFDTLDASDQPSASLYFDTNYVYSGLTTASIKVANLSAKYGGDIVSATLNIGNQSVSRSDNGVLSILLDSAGTFVPTVVVTDSRGQTSHIMLDAIIVNGYNAPSVSFTVDRTVASGVPDDEGTYCVISPTITFTDVVATAQAPTVTVTDEDGVTATPTVSWYSARSSSGVLSGSVTWANLSSGDTVYGLISGFGTQESYQITVTPRDSEGVGTPITQTLATAFYTVDFLAGGHGIAFGKPAGSTGFECDMTAKFLQGANVVGDTNVDGNVDISGFYKINGVNLSAADIGALASALVADYVVEEGAPSQGSYYRKWNSGKAEYWYRIYNSSGVTTSVWSSPIYYADYNSWSTIWQGVFNVAPSQVITSSNHSQFISVIPTAWNENGVTGMRFVSVGARSSSPYGFTLYALGTWK